MKGKAILLTGASLLAVVTYSQAAMADGSRMKPSYEALEDRIEDLEQRLDEKEQSDKAAKLRTRVSNLEERADAVQWSFENLRPTVKTGDNRFSMSIRGRFQVDWASYWQDDFAAVGVPTAERDLSGGAVVRRARLGVEGKAWDDFWYELRFDFGGSGTEGSGLLNIARVAYNFGDPDWRLNVGIMQPVFTYQNAVSSADLTFVERPSVVAIAVDEFGGDSARRALELTYQHTDLLWKGDNIVITGALSGQRVGQADTLDETTNVLGRVAWRLWSDGVSNFQIGGSAAQVLDYQGGPAVTARFRERPESRPDGDIRLVDTSFAGDGNAMRATGQWLYGFEAGLNLENFFIGGEYYTFGIDRDFTAPTGSNDEPEFDGWYVESSYVLIGGPKSFATKSSSNNYAVWGQPRISRPFGWGESIGALELAVRYSTVDLNFNEGVVGAATPDGGVRGGEQSIWTFGLNWYLNPNIRVILDYQDIEIEKIDDATPAAGSSANGFAGQDLNAAIGRVQFTF
jgi:phosphate-selective porin OprO/OprP